jgi:polyvinyl alcohol dehydrogenase (cytochrome)
MSTSSKRFCNSILTILAGLTCAFALNAVAQEGEGDLWSSGGKDNHNNRNASTETKISPENAADLTVKWAFSTSGDVTATPAVDADNVYVPDWGGKLYSLDRETGAENWSIDIGDYNGLSPAGPAGPGGGLSRTTPVVFGNSLILGDQGGREFAGASVLSVNKNSGALNWITIVEEHPAALVTTSSVVHGNTVYVGVASNDEGFAAFVPNYPCCSARGSVMALNANTGEVLWKTYMVPESSTGFSGNSVWGSTPVVDTKRGSVYVTTGNNFSAPADVLACIAVAPDEATVKACVDVVPGNHFDSIVALDMYTGEIKWATKALPFDAWTVACIFPIPSFGPFDPDGNIANCPMPAGPDYDFGQGPALYTVHDGSKGKPRELLGAGQKSGQYWALDPDDGSVVWVSQAGGGSPLGGLQWGSATDGKRVYTANTIAGWSALDAGTGEDLWLGQQTPPGGITASTNTFGAATVANGVVFVGSTAPGPTDPNMFALDAATGDILYSFASGGSVGSGAAVVDGTVYWGSGYSLFGPLFPYTGNNVLYAFEVP